MLGGVACQPVPPLHAAFITVQARRLVHDYMYASEKPHVSQSVSVYRVVSCQVGRVMLCRLHVRDGSYTRTSNPDTINKDKLSLSIPNIPLKLFAIALVLSSQHLVSIHFAHCYVRLQAQLRPHLAT